MKLTQVAAAKVRGSEDHCQSNSSKPSVVTVGKVDELFEAGPAGSAQSSQGQGPMEATLKLATEWDSKPWRGPGDPFHEWYSSPETDWEECKYLVPKLASQLLLCQSEEPEQSPCQYILESASWPGIVHLDQALGHGIDQHRVLAQVLELDEEGNETDKLGDIAGMSMSGMSKLCKLESDNKSLQHAVDCARIHHAYKLCPLRK